MGNSKPPFVPARSTARYDSAPPGPGGCAITGERVFMAPGGDGVFHNRGALGFHRGTRLRYCAVGAGDQNPTQCPILRRASPSRRPLWCRWRRSPSIGQMCHSVTRTTWSTRCKDAGFESSLDPSLSPPSEIRGRVTPQRDAAAVSSGIHVAPSPATLPAPPCPPTVRYCSVYFTHKFAVSPFPPPL